MRTKTIECYSFNELSEKAKEKAYYKWLEYHEYPYHSENIKSVENFCNHFKCTLKNYSYDSQTYDFSLSFDDEDIVGRKAINKILERLQDLRSKKVYKGNNHLSCRRTSKITYNNLDCPFTGYYLDDVLLLSIYDSIEKAKKYPDNVDYHWFITQALNSAFSQCVSDVEYHQSYDCFLEYEGLNEYDYDVHGNLV